MTKETGIFRAIKKAGSQSALARQIGVDRALVQRWCKYGYVPTLTVIGRERARMISDLTGVGYSTLLRTKARKPGSGRRRRQASSSEARIPSAD